MSDWFDYTGQSSYDERVEKENKRVKSLEEEFDKVFGDMYKELGLNFKK